LLLSAVEQHALFRSLAPDNLQHLTSLFEEAWGLVHAWHLDYSSDAFQVSENTRSFVDWVNRVVEALGQINAITSAQLADQPSTTNTTGHLYLTGFDVLTAQQQVWLKHAEERGATVHLENVAPVTGRQQQTKSASRFSSVTAEG